MDFKSVFMKQKVMRKVIFSLIPILTASVYFFGLRVLAVLVVVSLAGILSEYAIMRYINGKAAKVSEAVLVTCLLYTLTLPAKVPFWVAIVGIVFGVVFGKGVFGGFGKNIFNPALVGRCFIYISFPAYMTVDWVRPFGKFPGGLTRYIGGVDAYTSATPLVTSRDMVTAADYLRLFLGNVAGSMGETSALLIIAAAIYLIVTHTASWKIILSCVGSYSLLSSALYLAGITHDPLFTLLSGGFLFAAVFMATDPISAPSNDTSKIIYGILIGSAAFTIRSFSLFREGIMFAVLIANTFAPLIDKHVKEFKDRRKQVAA